METTTIDADERALAEAFRAGDPGAVQEIYRRYAGPLLSLARAKLADADQARDAVQQTFLQAWRASGGFHPDRPLAPWLFQICRRVCIDRHRRERALIELLEDHEDRRELAVEGPSLERSWIVDEVRRAIAQLPAEHRAVVRLFHLDGWSIQMIAEHEELPIGTVKSRLFRAHRRLADALVHLQEPLAA